MSWKYTVSSDVTDMFLKAQEFMDTEKYYVYQKQAMLALLEDIKDHVDDVYAFDDLVDEVEGLCNTEMDFEDTLSYSSYEDTLDYEDEDEEEKFSSLLDEYDRVMGEIYDFLDDERIWLNPSSSFSI